MVTIEDYDVSECFQHSRSTESVKSTVSETYLSKPSIAKRRANQQETEQFYFMVCWLLPHSCDADQTPEVNIIQQFLGFMCHA